MTSSHHNSPIDPARPETYFGPALEALPDDADPAAADAYGGRNPRQHRKIVVPVLLFLATCLSTFTIGLLMCYRYTDSMSIVDYVLAGWPFGLQYMTAVMGILLAHEMGHFLQALRHGIPASLPFFIPAPIPPIGTMGAVMAIQGSRADRRQLFDIGITGPLAGLVLAIPIATYGIWSAGELAPIQPPKNVLLEDQSVSISLQDPLIFKPLIHWLHPTLPAGYDLEINPLFLAGWFGMLITGLNMMPISQLDGGHVAYALFGRRAHLLARIVLLAAVVFILVSRQYGWSVMLALVVFIGPNHPPTADDHAPMGWGRRLVGLASLAIPILCFIPIPAKILS
ncbi:MAG TPA: site-2 protease family protein [Pirellulales bacterium]|jgi:membrane-associated protease RseP (regulator of RpoE activity)|nr:site-2 protease family protein [Pirellulales bacterium]